MDDFNKTTIRISVQQAEILLELCKTVDTSDNEASSPEQNWDEVR